MLDTINAWTTDLLGDVPISYRSERRVDLDFGFVEVGSYEWRSPIDKRLTWNDDYYTVNFALSERPQPAGRLNVPAGENPRSGRLPRLLVFTPGKTFHLSVSTGVVKSLQFAVSKQRLEEIAGDQFAIAEDLSLTPQTVSAPVIEFLLNRIHHELREDWFGRDAAIRAYADAFCLEFVRLNLVSRRSERFRKGGLPGWQMHRLRERIEGDAPPPKLDELADMCGMTVRHLSRAFKAETGTSLGKFIDHAIVGKADSLLIETDLPIGTIARKLGFSSTASFTYAYRRMTGTRPGDRRRQRSAAPDLSAP